MKRSSAPFKWRHYAPDVILLCVRWYCRYSLSYREQGFRTAERTLENVEAIHMMSKGRVKRLDGGDSVGQARFVESLFGGAAQSRGRP